MNSLHVGTSGWSYRHWKGVFYPEDLPQRKFLEYYLTRFDCVELNASFYRLPTRGMIAGWDRKLPQHFRLTPKLSQLITHRRRLRDVESDLSTFMERFEPLYDRLGPILVQLPPSLAYVQSSAESFCAHLQERYGNFSFVVEARNSSWFTDTPLALLRTYGVGWVIADSGGHYPEREALTSPTVYLRFHGPAGLFASSYSPDQLDPWAGKVRIWLDAGHQVWAFFNNDGNGYAVQNAITLRSLITESKL